MAHRGFVTEWNQPDPRIDVVADRLRSYGYVVTPLRHKTSLLINYSEDTGEHFPSLLNLLRSCLVYPVGSILIMSRKSGRYGVIRSARRSFRWL